MSNITLRRARQNRVFKGNLELRLTNGQGPYVLPQAANTYELRLYRHNATVPFATATTANTKLSINVTVEATVLAYNFPASDMAGLSGYGSMELISTVANAVPVVIPPLFFDKESTPYTIEDGEKLVIYNENVVAVVSVDLAGAILEGVAVVVNVLPPGSPSSAAFVGNSLTLNVPNGDTGSNGVMSAAEVARGRQALSRIPAELLARKAMVLDFVSGGYAHLDDVAGHELRSIENIPGVVLTNPTGGRAVSRKRVFANLAVDKLFLTHGADGAAEGALFAAGVLRKSGRTQPTLAQMPVQYGSVTDVAAPQSFGGQGLRFAAANVNTGIYHNVNAVAGQTHCLQYLVRTLDGLPPAVATVVGGAGDFSSYFDGGVAGLHPDTGAAGSKVTGPFADSVYLVQSYFTSPATAVVNVGVDRRSTQSGKPFDIIYSEVCPGRYPPPLFDNSTAIANARGNDRLQVPVSGFSFDDVVLATRFKMPMDGANTPVIAALDDGGAVNYILIYAQSSTEIRASVTAAGTSATVSVTGLAAGTSYTLVFMRDAVTKKIKLKVGTNAMVEAIDTTSFPAPPARLHVGQWLGGNHLKSTVQMLALVDRVWTPTDISKLDGMA
jgi:hypothetical protein